MYVLAIDDDPMSLQLVRLSLQTHGYEVGTIDNPAGVFVMIEKRLPDLLLVDVRMPGMTGFELVERLADMGYHIPAIFVTACNNTEDKLRGFTLSAEDYICKPYDFQELLARVKVAERHIMGRPMPRDVKAGPFKLLPDTFQVMVNDDTLVTLTPTELQILTMLMTNAGRIIKRETFFDRLWQTGSSNVLDVYISRLRRKLGPAGKRIEAQRGFGYVLQV